MANKRITELTTGTSLAAADVVPYVDIDDTTDAASGTTKKITRTNLALTLTAEIAANTKALTNTTFDADATGNSITNIENADIKASAAIDASKIADGSVSNSEFQYLNGVTSGIQNQIDTHVHAASDITSGTLVHERGGLEADVSAYSGLVGITAGATQAVASTGLTTGGTFEIDGDKLDIDYTPTNYTPSTTPTEADNADNLTAHLYGIDQAIGNIGLSQTLSWGGNWTTTGNFLGFNGAQGDIEYATSTYRTRAPVAYSGTINVVAFSHEGSFTTNNMTFKLHVNGTVQSTKTATAGADLVDVFTGMGVAVSAGDYVDVEYDAGATAPGGSCVYAIVEPS